MIEVIRNRDDFNRRRYLFHVLHSPGEIAKIVLSNYYTEKRVTKRHAWRYNIRYERLSKRNSNVGLNQVPMEENIFQEAKRKFIDETAFYMDLNVPFQNREKNE